MDSQKPNNILPLSLRSRVAEESSVHSAELLSELSSATTTPRLVLLPIEAIDLSPFQTREVGGAEELEELKASIESRGVIQPISVRLIKHPTAEAGEATSYELIAGERRLRAAQLAGLNTIPAIIQTVTDQGSVEMMIIENAQRENLNPIEEAQAYLILADRFKVTHAEIAKIVGKNRATVANSLRLLQLEPEVIELLRNGELTAGHGRALLMVELPEWQLKLAKMAVSKALSVRALEGLVSRLDEAEQLESQTPEEDEKERQARARAEARISDYLGIEKVSLRSDTLGHRKLTLSFDSEASWRRFISKIKD